MSANIHSTQTAAFRSRERWNAAATLFEPFMAALIGLSRFKFSPSFRKEPIAKSTGTDAIHRKVFNTEIETKFAFKAQCQFWSKFPDSEHDFQLPK
jgi:hypothetical protein